MSDYWFVKSLNLIRQTTRLATLTNVLDNYSQDADVLGANVLGYYSQDADVLGDNVLGNYSQNSDVLGDDVLDGDVLRENVLRVKCMAMRWLKIF